MPITSPVDFISGPKIGSTLGNLSNGSTASLTKNIFSGSLFENPSSFKLFPTIVFAATFTRELPIHFEIKGTVLDALGFTSRMKTSLSLIAN